MAGVDLPTLKELMGHSGTSTTMRYVHPTPKHKAEAVRKLERYNQDQVFALYEQGPGSPQESPQCGSERKPQVSRLLKIWRAWGDLNARPLVPETSALSN